MKTVKKSEQPFPQNFFYLSPKKLPSCVLSKTTKIKRYKVLILQISESKVLVSKPEKVRNVGYYLLNTKCSDFYHSFRIFMAAKLQL
jgi:hypothetical protein